MDLEKMNITTNNKYFDKSTHERKPLVSVIIPVYNTERYIAQTIESLIKQPCKDMEIIIVNDGSTDNSEFICRKFMKSDSRIHFYSQSNSGVSVARNMGIEKARGEYIAFLDADDVWCKDIYDDKLVTKILSLRSDIISFGFIVTDERMAFGNFSLLESKENINGDEKFDYSWQHFSSYFYKNDVIRLNNIRFTEHRKLNEDCEFRFKCFCASKSIQIFDSYLFCYRNNVFSITHRKTDVNIFFQDAVYAWCNTLFWVKANTQYYSEKSQEICEGTILNNICEYIKIAAENGESAVCVKEVLDKNSLMKVLINEKNLYMNQNALEIQRMFLKDSDEYFRMIKKKSFIKRCVVRCGINKSMFFRRLQQRLRYKNKIKGYVY